MKITTKQKKTSTEKEILSKDLEPGTVFLSRNGVTVLKLINERYVLLKFSMGSDWLEIDDNLTKDPVIEVLGMIAEIIVEKT